MLPTALPPLPKSLAGLIGLPQPMSAEGTVPGGFSDLLAIELDDVLAGEAVAATPGFALALTVAGGTNGKPGGKVVGNILPEALPEALDAEPAEETAPPQGEGDAPQPILPDGFAPAGVLPTIAAAQGVMISATVPASPAQPMVTDGADDPLPARPVALRGPIPGKQALTAPVCQGAPVGQDAGPAPIAAAPPAPQMAALSPATMPTTVAAALPLTKAAYAQLHAAPRPAKVLALAPSLPGSPAAQSATPAGDEPALPTAFHSAAAIPVVPPASPSTVAAPAAEAAALREAGDSAKLASTSAPTNPGFADLQPLMVMRDALAAPASVAAPVFGPTPVPSPGPAHDFAALVDRLVEAREAAAPNVVRATIAHGDFGPVSVRFQSDPGGLTVRLASADPGFGPAVQAAAALQTGMRSDADAHDHHPSPDQFQRDQAQRDAAQTIARQDMQSAGGFSSHTQSQSTSRDPGQAGRAQPDYSADEPAGTEQQDPQPTRQSGIYA